MATLKVRLGKRQRQNSIQPLNLDELKEDKAVQFAAEVTNRFTATFQQHALDPKVNELGESLICCFRHMTLLPLHLVVNWQVFTTNSIYRASIASHGKN